MNAAAASTFSILENLTGHLALWGGWGIAATLFLFALAAVSIIPRPALCVLAGAAYGLWGIPLAVIGTTLGAALAFGVGGALVARWPHLVPARGKTRAVVEAVRTEGWRIVVLLRLTPILPSSVLSLAFGVSAVPFVPYCVATIFGILPGVLLEVVLGATAAGGSRGEVHGWQLGLLCLGIAAGLAALWLVAQRVRDKLRPHLDEAN